MNREDDPLSKAYNILFGLPKNTPIFVQMIGLLGDTFPPIRHLRNMTQYIRTINEQIVEKITQSLLDKNRRELKDNNTPHTKKDILSLIVRDDLGLEDPLTDKEITDQCLTFLAASHETTSTSLTWTLLRSAENPRVQEKLRRAIFEKSDAAEFKPERFLDNNAIPDTARTPFANLTFLAGPRNCIERCSPVVTRPKSGQLHLRVKRTE
ncbi:hypothetical protein PROFUN_01416 [Planoprotostelium fungivorum]|uniref:Cytochrome P450 n=1 Tax=Planoprotostelium fungivorum TaxID=1890364 RepID=A0A2P6NT76_9EUKA|nr:hypothetical protein PROFUN_01416 [Planoprotostelium fungivorum]